MSNVRVLGLSFDFHDASAAYVQSGELVASAAEERFTWQKHDASFPTHAIRWTLAGRVAPADLDVVAFYERPHEKFARVLHSTFDDFPHGAAGFASGMKRWLGSALWMRNVIAGRLQIDPRKVAFFDHHKSHVAQAFATSPFEESAVLVVDAVGEWDCTTLATASRQCGVRVLESLEYPHSLGLVYAAFTAFLGFKPNSGEASTMALAAFGRPNCCEQVTKVLTPRPDGTYRVDPRYLRLLDDGPGLFTREFTDLFGAARPTGKPYAFDALDDTQREIPLEDQRHADIAASLQVVLEQVLLGLCARLHKASGLRNLCLAGGVALNCLANTRIIRTGLFERVFIPCDPGDGGAAAGAASLAAGFAEPAPSTPYLGPDAAEDALHPLLCSNDLAAMAEPAAMQACGARRVEHAQLPDGELIAAIVGHLSEGRIVGLVRGRLECGPRALGNRSLLVDPSNLQAIRRMSATVKSHTRFRPYALSMPLEAAGTILACGHLHQDPLRWMQSVWPIASASRDAARGGIHIDGTTRPQVCSREESPFFWRLLTAYGQARGVPAVLNTSFNQRSMPIVATGMEALVTFLRTGIDVLVVGNTLLLKR